MEHDKRALLAILNDHKTLILKERKSIDWELVGKDWDEYLSEAGEDEWRKIFMPVIQGVMTDRAKALVADFGFQFDVVNFYAREWYTDYMLQFAQPINDTTSTTLSNMLDQAMNEGWSIPEMQKNLTTTFDQWMKGDLTPEEFTWYSERMPAYRTENIARSETIRASNKGSKELFRDNKVEENEWLATNDSRVRPEHWAANGQVRKLDEPFDVGGEKLMYPADPAGSPENTCNDRCTLIPVIKEIE
ncbi:MAG: phage minor head protein [Candidatus Paceibacterota bacterium]|jgi:SPP1 gp7 family putative phage head morphogenesis protein